MIELLVVVAIISILASMLLPAVQKARMKAHASLCMSNMNQLGKAVVNYADEYQNSFPPHWNDNASSNWNRAVFLARPYYNNNFVVLRCPKDSEENNYMAPPVNDSISFDYDAAKHYSSFNYNMRITDGFTSDPVGSHGNAMLCRERDIKQPGSTVLYLEGDASKAGLKNTSQSSAIEPETDGPKPSWWAGPGTMRQVYLRHFYASHYLFGDIHIESRKPETITDSEFTREPD